MSLLDILITMAIAAYAMLGGALLNAAITAPENYLKLMSKNWKDIFSILAGGAALIIGGVLIMAFQIEPATSIDDNPLIYLGIAHIAIGGIFWLCRKISIDILL